MTTFDKAFNRLMDHEGVLSMNPQDPGNWTGGGIGLGELKGTKFGISAASYPGEDIPNLTRERAKEIFRRDFWDKINADQLHDGVAWQVSDFAYHSGPITAIRYLQRALLVADDGHWGPASQAAADASDESDTIMLLIAERQDYMTRLKNWPNAGRGWIRRMSQNLRYGAEDS